MRARVVYRVGDTNAVPKIIPKELTTRSTVSVMERGQFFFFFLLAVDLISLKVFREHRPDRSQRIGVLNLINRENFDVLLEGLRMVFLEGLRPPPPPAETPSLFGLWVVCAAVWRRVQSVFLRA